MKTFHVSEIFCRCVGSKQPALSLGPLARYALHMEKKKAAEERKKKKKCKTALRRRRCMNSKASDNIDNVKAIHDKESIPPDQLHSAAIHDQ